MTGKAEPLPCTPCYAVGLGWLYQQERTIWFVDSCPIAKKPQIIRGHQKIEILQIKEERPTQYLISPMLF